jgi:putative transposase
MYDKHKYNPKKHHRRSIRLKGYDYTQAGLYFITICCQNRAYLFGDIVNGEMILNEFGQIAFNEWVKTTEIRNNVELGEFVVMPNHIHGIIRLLGRGELHSPHNESGGQPPHIELGVFNTPQPPQPPDNELGVFNTPQPPQRGPSQSIGAIIRGYKSSVTKQLGLLGFNKKLWQRNYFEHIIRNEHSYQRISQYIINNPAKWEEDKFYKK